MFTNLCRKLLTRSLSSSRRPVKRVRRPVPFRPWLHVLEDRTLPSTFLVTTTGDTNANPMASPLSVVSLRDAINDANSVGGQNTILFQTAGTYGLNVVDNTDTFFGPNALPVITSNLTIEGPAGGVELHVTGVTMRLFEVGLGGSLTLENLTLSGGVAQGGAGGNAPPTSGGGGGGGGAGLGGAIVNEAGGQVTLIGCTLFGNEALGGNGGAGDAGFSKGGAGAGGVPYGGAGGALGNSGSAGQLGGGGGGGGGFGGASLGGSGGFGGGAGAAGSKLGGGAGGGGAGLGGAIFNDATGQLTILNSTLSGNTAQGGSGGSSSAGSGSGFGGAVFNYGGAVILFNDTISGNTAAQGGSGVYNLSDLTARTTSANVSNTIIDQYVDFGGKNFSTGSSNLAVSAAVNPGQPLTFTAVNSVAALQLGGLNANGGATRTMELLDNSPAINAGADLSTLFQGLYQLPTTDQRGVPRGSTWSIGAYQATASRLTVSGFSSQTAGVPGSFTVTAVDPFGKTARGYTNTVTLSATGISSLSAISSIPSGFFKNFSNGSGTYQATLSTPGFQTLSASDGTLSGSESFYLAANLPVVNEFTFTGSSFQQIGGITAGPDGNVWFVGTNQIGEINPATHAVSEFPFTGGGTSITVGPDGNVWFTDSGRNQIGEFNLTNHAVSEFAVPTADSFPGAITVGPDGNLWFIEPGGFDTLGNPVIVNLIGEINPTTHAISEFAVPNTPNGLTAGPDGNLWFTESNANQLGEFNLTTHAVSEFAIPTSPYYEPYAITAGPDGNLWFTDDARIGEMNPTTQAISFSALPSGYSYPLTITAGPDGNLWFTDAGSSTATGYIAEISPATHAVIEAAAVTANIMPTGITAGPDGNLLFIVPLSGPDSPPAQIEEVALASVSAALAGNNQSTTVGTAFGTRLVVQVSDAFGPVSGAPVTFTETNGPGGAGGAFTGTTTVLTNAQGLAMAPVLTADDTAGSFTVSATLVGGLSTTFNLTNTPGAPAAIQILAGTPQNTPIGSVYGTLFQAQVTDAFGNPTPNVPVTFSAPTSGASGSFQGPATTPTNALGIATAPAFTANHVLGSFTVTAAVAGVHSPVSFALTNTDIPTTLATVGGTPQKAVVNSTYTTPLQVRITDADGEPVSGITVDFALPGQGPSGTWTGGAQASLVLTDTNGVATTTRLMANTTAGTFTVKAWVAGVAAPVKFLLTNLPGPTYALNAFKGSPQSAIVASAYALPLQAQVADFFGNGIAGVKVTFTAPSTGPGGRFAAGLTASAVTGANGVAVAPTFTANTQAGSFNVVASTNLLSVLPGSFTLTNLPGPVAKITPLPGTTPQSTRVTLAFPVALTVKVTDAFGNVASGLNVIFTVHPSGTATATFATVTGTSLTVTTTTDVNGLATAPALVAGDFPGTFTVIASVFGVSAQGTFTLTIM